MRVSNPLSLAIFCIALLVGCSETKPHSRHYDLDQMLGNIDMGKIRLKRIEGVVLLLDIKTGDIISRRDGLRQILDLLCVTGSEDKSRGVLMGLYAQAGSHVISDVINVISDIRNDGKPVPESLDSTAKSWLTLREASFDFVEPNSHPVTIKIHLDSQSITKLEKLFSEYDKINRE